MGRRTPVTVKNSGPTSMPTIDSGAAPPVIVTVVPGA